MHLDCIFMKKIDLRKNTSDPINIPVITLMELYYGAYKSQKVTGNLAIIKTIEQSLEIIPVGIESVETFRMPKSKLENIGSRLDGFDLIIAASALSHDLTLVTNNEKHFQKIEDLKLTNWTLDSGMTSDS